MVIECSSCHARFKLADDKVKESGTKVRCTKCREVFTVFPESPPLNAPPVVAPVITEAPVKADADAFTQQQQADDESFFSGTDTSFFDEPKKNPAFHVSDHEDDNWNQETDANNLFTDGFTDDTGGSDLDAINFDNIEAPAFSLTNSTENKFEFTDDTAFSFNESAIESGISPSYNVAGSTDDQSLSGESYNDFELDDTSFAPGIAATEKENQSNVIASDKDFSFPEEDNLADLAWDEPDTAPGKTTPTEKSLEIGADSQDAAFDFSSFSFDEASPSAGTDEYKTEETTGEGTIELTTGNETAPVTIKTENTPGEEIPPPPLVREHQESTPRPARPLRPRLRQKRKGSNRLAVKVLILILLVLGISYGILNRTQIQKTYNNFVNSFIDNQTRLETSGRIGLDKLSGSYVFNNQEGDLFVIRGEVVNEFKGLRSSVLVKGTIFGDKGEVIQSQSAFCGNPIKDISLKNLGYKEIRNIMSNELGENLVNLNIATGKGIPFTIVFNKVPKNIKEFTVEVLESKPGSK